MGDEAWSDSPSCDGVQLDAHHALPAPVMTDDGRYVRCGKTPARRHRETGNYCSKRCEDSHVFYEVTTN